MRETCQGSWREIVSAANAATMVGGPLARMQPVSEKMRLSHREGTSGANERSSEVPCIEVEVG